MLAERYNHICVLICLINLCFVDKENRRASAVAHAIISSMGCVYIGQTLIYHAQTECAEHNLKLIAVFRK